jgi:hypothetical protein
LIGKKEEVFKLQSTAVQQEEKRNPICGLPYCLPSQLLLEIPFRPRLFPPAREGKQELGFRGDESSQSAVQYGHAQRRNSKLLALGK